MYGVRETGLPAPHAGDQDGLGRKPLLDVSNPIGPGFARSVAALFAPRGTFEDPATNGLVAASGIEAMVARIETTAPDLSAAFEAIAKKCKRDALRRRRT